MGKMDKMEGGRRTFEARPKRERRSLSLLAWAVAPAFLGVLAVTSGDTGWAAGLFAVAALLALPGLIGLVLSDD